MKDVARLSCAGTILVLSLAAEANICDAAGDFFDLSIPRGNFSTWPCLPETFQVSHISALVELSYSEKRKSPAKNWRRGIVPSRRGEAILSLVLSLTVAPRNITTSLLGEPPPHTRQQVRVYTQYKTRHWRGLTTARARWPRVEANPHMPAAWQLRMQEA